MTVRGIARKVDSVSLQTLCLFKTGKILRPGKTIKIPGIAFGIYPDLTIILQKEFYIA